MKCLCYLGILKEGFSPYSSPVMLISWKLTQDKRVVMDFWHLNVRIAKNNFAYPLEIHFLFWWLKMWSSFGIRFKRHISFIKTFWKIQRNMWYITIFWKCIIYTYQRMPMGLNISPSIWQSYINAVLQCLQSRKHCEEIMDDLYFLHPQRKHTWLSWTIY